MRKRMISPEFYSDDKILELEIPQRLLFIGMWNFSDDSGVIKYSSKQIKAQIFPADSITPGVISEWVVRLHELGLILFNKDRTLIKIKGWTNYQKINRPTPSKYEFIEELIEPSLNTQGALITNRREEKGSSLIEVSIIEKKAQRNLLVQTDEGFEQFYSIYPRKVSKKASTKAFKKLTKKEKALVIEILPKHIKHWNDKNTEMDYIPHPSTWLNQRKWEDELIGDISIKQNNMNKHDERQREYFREIKEKQKNNPPATPQEVSDIISGVVNKLSISGKS